MVVHVHITPYLCIDLLWLEEPEGSLKLLVTVCVVVVCRGDYKYIYDSLSSLIAFGDSEVMTLRMMFAKGNYSVNTG
jgi:hypothetical protein